ncbi:MAG: lysophospholipid acyltransferase family protein [bacterium]
MRALLWPVVWIAAALPAGAADALGRALGWVWYRVVPIRRGVARANVAAALGTGPAETEVVVAGMYRHLGRAFVELLRFTRRRPSVRVEGREHLDAALAAGRGALVLTAHLGNWELLVQAGMWVDRPVSVVTKRLRAGWAEAAWRALRRGGPALFPAGASARLVVAALGRGEVVGYVLDQHSPEKQAVRAPFFGRMAATSGDLVRLARLTGAAVVPVFIWRAGGEHVIRVGPAVALAWSADKRADVEVGTRRCLAVVEAAIAARPEQWLWIHRRWKGAAADAGGGRGGSGSASPPGSLMGAAADGSEER